MAGKYIHTLYSLKTGLDIIAETKENESKNLRTGMVQLRFFHLQSPTDGKITQIKFNLDPWEAYDMYLKINKVWKEGGKEKITHKFKNGKQEEVITSVVL